LRTIGSLAGRSQEATDMSTHTKTTRARQAAEKAATIATATATTMATGDEAGSTRLFVQNLPAYVDSARLRAHFEAQGEVTDACVIRTKDGKKSRRFGFVGFKTEQQAQHAMRFFDKTFFDTSRLAVRLAHMVSAAASIFSPCGPL
jgi:hypothetical protein